MSTAKGFESNYAVGLSPKGVAFDSGTSSIWVSNNGSNTVSKVNRLSGASTSYDVGTSPLGVAYDSYTATIWVANSGSSSISQVNITTGTSVSYTVSADPRTVTFDPVTHSIWVTHASTVVEQIDVTTGNISATYAAVGAATSAVYESYTQSIWLVQGTTLSRIRITNGDRTDYVIPAGYGIAYDSYSNSIWVGCSGSMLKINPSTGTYISTFVPSGNPINGVVFDDTTNTIWCISQLANSAYQILVTTGAVASTYATATSPEQIVSDHVNSVWITQSTAGTVGKMAVQAYGVDITGIIPIIDTITIFQVATSPLTGALLISPPHTEIPIYPECLPTTNDQFVINSNLHTMKISFMTTCPDPAPTKQFWTAPSTL